MTWSPLLGAALDAADRGWHVFPVVRASKVPALRNWEQRATTDKRQVYAWWANDSRKNVGVATGRSGLVVIDLDDGDGAAPPERFVGARNGRDVLAMLAAEVGEPVPTDTYEVATPSGGSHLYFRSPPGLVLRSTAGSLGWKIDSRSEGGFCVAAGSAGQDGVYRVVRDGEVAELPAWLARALSPPPPPTRPSLATVGINSLDAYVRAAVAAECAALRTALVGTRHDQLHKAARILGEFVGADRLTEHAAREALWDAAAAHVGVEGFTASEVARTIADGLSSGGQRPRLLRPAVRQARGPG